MNIFTKLRLASYRKKAIDKESAAKYYHIIEPEIFRLYQTVQSMVQANRPFKKIEPVHNDFSAYCELVDYLREKACIKESDTKWGRFYAKELAESKREVDESERRLEMLNSNDEAIRKRALREIEAEERSGFRG